MVNSWKTCGLREHEARPFRKNQFSTLPDVANEKAGCLSADFVKKELGRLVRGQNLLKFVPSPFKPGDRVCTTTIPNSEYSNEAGRVVIATSKRTTLSKHRHHVAVLFDRAELGVVLIHKKKLLLEKEHPAFMSLQNQIQRKLKMLQNGRNMGEEEFDAARQMLSTYWRIIGEEANGVPRACGDCDGHGGHKEGERCDRKEGSAQESDIDGQRESRDQRRADAPKKRERHCGNEERRERRRGRGGAGSPSERSPGIGQSRKLAKQSDNWIFVIVGGVACGAIGYGAAVKVCGTMLLPSGGWILVGAAALTGAIVGYTYESLRHHNVEDALFEEHDIDCPNRVCEGGERSHGERSNGENGRNDHDAPSPPERMFSEHFGDLIRPQLAQYKKSIDACQRGEENPGAAIEDSTSQCEYSEDVVVIDVVDAHSGRESEVDGDIGSGYEVDVFGASEYHSDDDDGSDNWSDIDLQHHENPGASAKSPDSQGDCPEDAAVVDADELRANDLDDADSEAAFDGGDVNDRSGDEESSDCWSIVSDQVQMLSDSE